MEQKSVKILLAITKSNWGGAQRYVYDVANHFNSEKGFTVKVLTGGNGGLVTKLRESSIPVLEIPHIRRDISLLKDLKSFFWICKIIRKEKPDVLHVNSSKMGLFGALAGRLCRVRTVIFTAHAWPFNEGRPLYQRLIFRALAFITVLLAHKTIAVSHAVIKSLKAPHFLAKKITCVYTGIKTPTLYEKGAFFAKFNLAKTKGIHIVSIGELHMSKGHDRAILALATCKHLPFVYHIIGEGEKRPYLEKLIAQLELQEKVILHGFVEDASLYLNSFDLFLFPSRTEALGYVAIEALFTKLPIIASKAGGIPEALFDDPYTKLVDCDDEKKFREALLFMLHKLPTVDENKRPGKMRFLPKVMFTATKKIYLS